MNENPTYVTHYYESEYGPFRNICDLPESEWGALIEKEKHSNTEFNRFFIGLEFFRNRCEADNILIQLYEEKFEQKPSMRPSYATLGSFDRTNGMYRAPSSIEFPLSLFEEHEITFIYEDHGHLGWMIGSQDAPDWFEEREYHTLLFSKSELEDAFQRYGLGGRIKSARENSRWVSSYVEAHIWVDFDTLDQRSQPGESGQLRSLRSLRATSRRSPKE